MKVAVLGAGAIGCYIGAALAHAGLNVTLIGRQRLLDELTSVGELRLTDYLDTDLPVTSAKVTTSASLISEADLILLTVKCLGVAEAAEQIRTYAKPDATILSLQNGIGSEQPLLDLPNPVVRGIVGFNVAPLGKGRFHRGTEGDIYCEPFIYGAQLSEAFAKTNIECKQTDKFEAVRWAKLQLNLNNAINALSDLPLKKELETHAYRKILSAAMNELLLITKAKGLTLPKMTKLPANWLPTLIKIPNFLFTRLASNMLEIDPEARSSMWEDLNLRRKTEIDFINGAVVKEAQKIGLNSPANAALCALIKTAEENDKVTHVSPDKILKEIKQKK